MIKCDKDLTDVEITRGGALYQDRKSPFVAFTMISTDFLTKLGLQHGS